VLCSCSIVIASVGIGATHDFVFVAHAVTVCICEAVSIAVISLFGEGAICARSRGNAIAAANATGIQLIPAQTRLVASRRIRRIVASGTVHAPFDVVFIADAIAIKVGAAPSALIACVQFQAGGIVIQIVLGIVVALRGICAQILVIANAIVIDIDARSSTHTARIFFFTSYQARVEEVIDAITICIHTVTDAISVHVCVAVSTAHPCGVGVVFGCIGSADITIARPIRINAVSIADLTPR
jgi:hypothetical protein